jgi:hypothetical protein
MKAGAYQHAVLRGGVRIGAGFVAIAALLCTIAVSTLAQTTAPNTNRVRITYVPPDDPSHRPLYQFLRQHNALEKLQELLTPFRLPRTLAIRLEGCDGESNAWYEDDAVTVCYEYMDDVWKNAPKTTTAAGVAPIDAVMGPLYDVLLHETAHALFDLLKIPVFGREEDAADQVAAYLMLRIGKADARRLVLGTAYAYKNDFESPNAPITTSDFADEHGTPAQRFYNLLCIAYGADPKMFADMVEKKYLPKERAEGCEDEYQQVVNAFEKLITPHLDRSLEKVLLTKNWLPDLNARLPDPAHVPPPSVTR